MEKEGSHYKASRQANVRNIFVHFCLEKEDKLKKDHEGTPDQEHHGNRHESFAVQANEDAKLMVILDRSNRNRQKGGTQGSHPEGTATKTANGTEQIRIPALDVKANRNGKQECLEDRQNLCGEQGK